jgi:hypothetical protein
MNSELLNQNFNEIAECCEDMELDSIWLYLRHDFTDFLHRKDAFLWVVNRLTQEGTIKLIGMKSSIPLEGTVEEQIERFRQAFPKSDEEMENGLWFFYEACPAGCDWKWRFSKTYGTQISD